MQDEVIMEGAAFDLPNDNYEEFDQTVNQVRLGKKLVYSNTLKGTTRTYQFHAGRDLLLNFVEKKKSAAKIFRINLAWLSPEPLHKRVIVWEWLFGALGAVALSGLCLYLAIEKILPWEYCAVAGLILLTGACISSLIFIYLLRDEYFFTSHYGGAVIFMMDNKKPNQAEFDDFFTHLQASIEKAQAKMTVTNKLVGELKMCRRLKDEGILKEQQYTTARSIIFKHEQYKV